MTTNTPTRSAFLAAYKKNLFATQSWARDMNRFLPFMANVRITIEGQDTGWWPDSIEAVAAWYEIGMMGTPTITKLRALLE